MAPRGAIITEITNVGGVDETWYNSGDNRYYVAARDMPNGPVMGVIDAKTNTLAAKRYDQLELAQHRGGFRQ